MELNTGLTTSDQELLRHATDLYLMRVETTSDTNERCDWWKMAGMTHIDTSSAKSWIERWTMRFLHINDSNFLLVHSRSIPSSLLKCSSAINNATMFDFRISEKPIDNETSSNKKISKTLWKTHLETARSSTNHDEIVRSSADFRRHAFDESAMMNHLQRSESEQKKLAPTAHFELCCWNVQLQTDSMATGGITRISVVTADPITGAVDSSKITFHDFPAGSTLQDVLNRISSTGLGDLQHRFQWRARLWEPCSGRFYLKKTDVNFQVLKHLLALYSKMQAWIRVEIFCRSSQEQFIVRTSFPQVGEQNRNSTSFTVLTGLEG